MSHAATKWAFDQPELHRDMKPSEWAVLMVLADCHNPVNGCFPSQEYICAKTNLGERAVRDQLARLRERGLIDWDAARENGRRGSNRYSLGFEPQFQPAKSAGSPTGDIAHDQPADSGSFNRQNLPPNPVREPVKEPERETRAQEPEDRKAIERAFERAWQAWPTSVSDSRPAALKAWLTLSGAEREAASGEMARWLEANKATGRKHVPAFGSYLTDKRWENLPPPEQQAEASVVEAKPFGPWWMAARLKMLLSGPTMKAAGLTSFEQVLVADGKADPATLMLAKQAKCGWPSINAMHQRASERRGVTVSVTLRHLAELMESVPVGSAMFDAWRQEHELRGWPWLPDPGEQPVVYFPVGGPGALGDFEAAIRGRTNDGNRQEAAE